MSPAKTKEDAPATLDEALAGAEADASAEVEVEAGDEVAEVDDTLLIEATTPEGVHAAIKWRKASVEELEAQVRSWHTAEEVKTIVVKAKPVELPADHNLSREQLLRYLVALHETPAPIKPLWTEFSEGAGDEGED